MSGDLTVDADMSGVLDGDAQARNILWQVAGTATLEAGSHLEGVILSQTAIIIRTGASMTGRALARSGITLNESTATAPAE